MELHVKMQQDFKLLKKKYKNIKKDLKVVIDWNNELVDEVKSMREAYCE